MRRVPGVLHAVLVPDLLVPWRTRCAGAGMQTLVGICFAVVPILFPAAGAPVDFKFDILQRCHHPGRISSTSVWQTSLISSSRIRLKNGNASERDAWNSVTGRAVWPLSDG